jgi:hypothetical protein
MVRPKNGYFAIDFEPFVLLLAVAGAAAAFALYTVSIIEVKILCHKLVEYNHSA